jgi:putative transcriptional regulator
MNVSYNGLWKKLIDKGMQKKDLMEVLSISSTTIAKMGKGEKVSLDVLERICLFFDCNVGDIMSFEKQDAAEKNRWYSYGENDN